jgi:hypothetical protein
LELAPGAPITVRHAPLFGIHVSQETVLSVIGEIVHYGNSIAQHVSLSAESITWARGWNTKDAQALEAQAILEASA